MKPQIILREIAASAADFVNLPVISGDYCNAGSDTVAVGLVAYGFDKNPVFLVAHVLEQAGSVIHIVDYDFEAAVVVQISQGRSPRAAAIENRRSRLRRDIQEFPVPRI